MAGVLKMLLVLALLASASDGSDASRALRGEAIGRSGGEATRALVVVSKAKAGHSGCTNDPNTHGPRCRP
uniref:Uncharacterized protein n=1 Tax=Oryza brachyantha TaxID=4533 RepID=J3LSJ5_ORYBR